MEITPHGGYRSSVEGADGFYYGLLFVVAEFGVDGEGQHLVGGLLCDGEGSGGVAEGAKGFLEVQRERVVDLCGDGNGRRGRCGGRRGEGRG